MAVFALTPSERALLKKRGKTIAWYGANNVLRTAKSPFCKKYFITKTKERRKSSLFFCD